jgi:virginiamycin B lyase
MIPIVIAAVALMALGVKPAAATEVTYFEVPRGAHPHDVAPAPDGNIWYTAQSQGAIGVLNPKSGQASQISLGNGAAPHGVIVGPDRAAWITDGGQNAIVRFDPSSKAVKLFRLPEEFPGANLNTATFDRKGILWFTGQSGVYGRVDPSSGKVEAWKHRKAPAPTALQRRRMATSGMPRLRAITLPRSIP